MRQPEGGFSRRQVLVTCEHASNDLPRGLELDPALLQLHIAYDPGAAEIARFLATEFRAPLHRGKYSRLVVDLNRTVGNRNLIRTVTDGHRILFNYGLSESDRRRRIERYYRPYRRAVARDVARIVAREGRCIHLCIHTYAPELAGKLRRNDIGILYDPERQPEAAAARQLRGVRGASNASPWPTAGRPVAVARAARRAATPRPMRARGHPRRRNSCAASSGGSAGRAR